MSERTTPVPPSRLPGIWTLVRDILSFLGGWVLVYLEVQRPEVRDSVLTLAGSLVVAPGIVAGVAPVVDALRSRGGTAEPSSPSAESPVLPR